MLKNYAKIAIYVLPILLAVVSGYLWYLNNYFDRSQKNWFWQGYSALEVQRETEKVNKLFESYFDSLLQHDPEYQSFLGIKTQYDRWTELTEAAYEWKNNFSKETLHFLKDSVLYECLDSNLQLSYQLLEKKLNLDIEAYNYRHKDYPINQMNGVHSAIPSFLINVHQIDSLPDAQAYIARLKGVEQKINQLIEQLRIREEKGVVPPQYLFSKFVETCHSIISGYPYEGNIYRPNLLFEDFQQKISKLKLPNEQEKLLLESCKLALVQSVGPAYRSLIVYLNQLHNKANFQAGVWKFEDGSNYYAFKLREQTSSSLSPEEVYTIGLEEVSRIHKEMEGLLGKMKFMGTLQSFFSQLRYSQQFYYPQTAYGKAEYLQKAKEIIDSMRPKLPELFRTLPKAAIEVRAVESFREKSAGKAFYEQAAPDGSRPAVYYVNTYDMSLLPKYQMEALAYHEGIPGHHMQLSIAQEMEGLPRFRRYADNYTAYVEGWGLYAEYIPKEMGFYQDPYSDFGRLSMELWRACRMVVDAGIHWKKWTREEAIRYYQQNTPNSEADCIKMVERHIVYPGQATSYKVGMITIIELRKKAKDKLGDKFDIRDFHEVLLRNGAVPLETLEDLVDRYIANSL